MSQKTHLISAIAVTALVSGCVMDASTESSESDVASVSSAVVGQDTYLYLRCNATSWNVDNTTRLRPTADPYVFSFLYDVKQDWMTTGGDSCVFTETNQQNGWGTAQTSYGTVHGTVSAPSGDYLHQNGGNFTVKYPALGRYKVTVNWMQGTFLINPASAAESWQPCGNESVTTFAQSPQAPNNMLVGCSNGDIFLTFNGLSSQASYLKVDSWATAGGTNNLPDLPVNAIAYSPADIKTAYIAFAGSKQGHKLWKTGTGGATWVELSNAPIGEIWSISVNPLDSSKVYVAGPGGVFMSPDYGTTWTSAVTAAPLTPPIAQGAKLSTVTRIGSDPNVVWVGTTNGDIFYTTNAQSGQNWIQATHGMPERMVLRVTGDATRTPATIYATFDGLSNDSVWITSNNAFGWANLHNPALPTSSIPLPGIYALYGVSINPVDSNVVYLDGTYGAGLSLNSGWNWSWTSTN